MTTQDLVLPIPVLVVEDDPIIQTRLKLILLELGYTEETLFFASSVAQANQILEQQYVSLALIDLGLPDGNGISIIQRIREQESHTLILVISAWSTQGSLS
ncbi:hypothetical protein A3K93_05360 [Acinetobacter sp. NCu2D-2]|uniref:response regulator n=1 Tax=Acinetobacter sp. NCu2D-2 TaxID=1608473 RepID=UPI0007CE0067|nr:response regulator [Acinetobacter sp. NCu2D-2]ANF81667.1 hypothetical protein A3K93_05360 [Acinetobacter sp. NCu2D-2]